MNEIFKKIGRTFLIFLIGVGATAATYLVSTHSGTNLKASILDGVDPSLVTVVEFVSPKGTAYPVNNVVTINSVFVNAGATHTGNVSGSDLANSFITFTNGAVACPAGTAFNANQIVLPSTFSAACSVKITIPGSAVTSTQDLTIQPVSCSALQTSLIRGEGAGFQQTLPLGSSYGTFAVTSNGFNFGAVTPISSIDLDYPATTVTGAKTFQVHLDFVPDVSIDPINGIDSRAKIAANNGNRVYEIKVRDEGKGNEVQTALNFAYVFNDLLGTDSPFIGYPKGTDPKTILLQATEMGTQGNSYSCDVNGAIVGPPCFAGGTDSTGVATGVLTTPLKLDNEVVQGDSSLIFAAKSAGGIQWISSHPSVLEVSTLSEASQQDKGTVNFIQAAAPAAAVPDETKGAYTINKCDQKYDTGTPPNFLSETCDTSIKVPVTLNISTTNFTANVAIKDEVVPVTLTGKSLDGFLEGTAQYSSSAGAGYSLTGTLTGTVTGSISGTYSGTVTGQIQANIEGSGKIGGKGAVALTVGDFLTTFTVLSTTTGTIGEVPNTFVSTVKKESEDLSYIGLIYGKRPGTSVLSAIDKQGCVASFDVNVIQKKVILKMVGRDPGDVLDVSNTVQINAFAGGADSQIDAYKNITAASKIEWASSNEQVATIDKTGLLTALKPGVTNITARWDTGDAEIGVIESDPLAVTVNKIAGLRVTFDKATEDKLPADVVKNAHKSVIIAIHDPQAAGQTFSAEGHTVSITLPTGTYNSDIAKVTAITGQLKTDLSALTNTVAQPILQVTNIDGYPGMLILQPINQDYDSNNDKIENIDENGIVDIDTTALESDVAILPTYDNAIPLPASDTYGLRVIAQYDNGATKQLPPTQFKWVNTPVNYLEQASLDSGLIKLGQISGTSTVVAQYLNADGSVVHSNYLTITVDTGPVIEYVRRIGSGSVTKGSRIILQVKVTDVNTISDITDISTSLVYSTFNTYQQIKEDTGAIWFSATPYLSEVTVADQSQTQSQTQSQSNSTTSTGSTSSGSATGTGSTTSTGTGSTSGTTSGSTSSTATTTNNNSTAAPAPVSPQFRTYNIPIEIPIDQNLFDGIYKLILSITDAENHTLNFVYPIRIGQIGGGDVNGDGIVNMLDVIRAFQIATGMKPDPTPAELQAANVDGIGGVTLVDVILLFNKVAHQ